MCLKVNWQKKICTVIGSCYSFTCRDLVSILAPMILILKQICTTAKTLLLLDRGFYHFSFLLNSSLSKLTLLQGSKLGLRLKLRSSPINTMLETNSLNWAQVVITLQSSLWSRFVSVKLGSTLHPLYPVVLPPPVVADLYRRRWRIEEAFPHSQTAIGFELFVDRFNQRCEVAGLGYLVILRPG